MIGNRIQGVTIGVGLTAETGARVAGNDVRAAGAAGIAGSNLAVTAALSGNRLRHCGHAGFIGSLGGSVLILTSLADIVIESCEILDTGIPPEGKRTLGIALGAWLWICLSCRVATT